MAARLDNVQISCAGGQRYEREAGGLARLYGALLGMERYDPGYVKVARPDGSTPEIGFEGDGGVGERRPRWPDPEHPQQIHLDIEVAELDGASRLAIEHGAVLLQDGSSFRVLADPAGHPFCLYPSTSIQPTAPGRIARVVFDCFSPRALAAFYEEMFDMRRRVMDAAGRVVIAGAGDRPMLAFQHAVFPAARWPDPDHPAQLHLDVSFEDKAAGQALVERLGGVQLRSNPSGHDVYADPAGHPFCLDGGPADPAAQKWRDEHWANRVRPT